MCPTSDALRIGWQPCTRHPGYEVHFDGRIRNIKSGRELKTKQASSGRYRKVTLGHDLQVGVHQLVCEAWWGPKPAGLPHSVDHVDFDSLRNVATNLRWLTVGRNSGQHRRSGWELRAAELVPPDDFTPITPDEERELQQQLIRNGWL